MHTKEMRPSDAPVLTPWRYRPSTLVRVSALFYALLAFGFGVFVSVGSFLTSLCTGKCLAQGGGPVPAWVPLLGLLVFSVIAAACASVGWISVSCDGQTLHIVRSWWRRRDVDLADIRVVRSGRYGPRITLLSGADVFSDVPQGDVNYGIDLTGAKPRASGFIAVITDDAAATRTKRHLPDPAPLTEEQLATQRRGRRRSLEFWLAIVVVCLAVRFALNF